MKGLKRKNCVISMPTFRVLPVSPGAENGWFVETTHEGGVVEKSVVLASQAVAQAAADSWQDLDEDWDAV
jgi:hypothetical protein